MSGTAGPSVNNTVPSSHLSLVPPPQSLAQDCPILIWMLSLNREYTAEVGVLSCRPAIADTIVLTGIRGLLYFLEGLY